METMERVVAYLYPRRSPWKKRRERQGGREWGRKEGGGLTVRKSAHHIFGRPKLNFDTSSLKGDPIIRSTKECRKIPRVAQVVHAKVRPRGRGWQQVFEPSQSIHSPSFEGVAVDCPNLRYLFSLSRPGTFVEAVYRMALISRNIILKSVSTILLYPWRARWPCGQDSRGPVSWMTVT